MCRCKKASTAGFSAVVEDAICPAEIAGFAQSSPIIDAVGASGAA